MIKTAAKNISGYSCLQPSCTIDVNSMNEHVQLHITTAPHGWRIRFSRNNQPLAVTSLGHTFVDVPGDQAQKPVPLTLYERHPMLDSTSEDLHQNLAVRQNNTVIDKMIIWLNDTDPK